MPELEGLDDAIRSRNWTIEIESGHPKRFDTFQSLRTFLTDELLLWDGIPSLEAFAAEIRSAANQLRHAETSDRFHDNVEAAWNSLRTPNIIYPSSTRGRFLRGLAAAPPHLIQGAVDFLLNRIGDIRNAEYASGVLAGALFSFPNIIPAAFSAQVAALDGQRVRLAASIDDDQQMFAALQARASAFQTDTELRMKTTEKANEGAFQGLTARWVTRLESADDEFSTVLTQAKTEIDAAQKTYNELK